MVEGSSGATEKIAEVAGSILTHHGLELVDLQCRREQRGWVLRLFIDREGGVTIDDCARVSEEVGAALDVERLIDHPYTLEVSSPGLDRPLKKEEDFRRFAGRQVRIRTSSSHEGRRNFKGRLLGFEDGLIRLDLGGREVRIALRDVAKANLNYEF